MSKVLEQLARKLNEQKEEILTDFRRAFFDLGAAALGADELQELAARVIDACFDYIILKRKAVADSIGARLVSLRLTNYDVLGKFQKILYQSIFQFLSSDEKSLVFDKFQDFVSKVAIGYNKSFVAELRGEYDQLDSLVDIRTRELSEANQKLAKEIRDHQLAERALGESETRYRTLAESAPDFIFIINRDDIVEYVNQHAGKLFNRQFDQLVGKKRQTLFGKSSGKLQERSLAQVFKNGQVLHVQEWVELKKGKRLFLDTILSPLKQQGEVQAVLGISRDITRQKIADEKSEEQETKYHSLFNKIHNAILLIENEIVIDSNRSTKQFFGEPPEAINGKSFISLLRKSPRRDKHFVEQLRRKIELCLDGKPQQFEVKYNRKDGVRLQLEIHMTHFPEGNGSQLLAVVRNITPYNEAIKALKTSELRFKDIINRSIDGYYFVDVDYKLQALNKAAEDITTFSKEEINSSLKSAPYDKRSKAMLKMLKTAMGGTSLSWEELEFTDRNGNRKWIALNARRVYNGGVVSGVEGFVKDITVRKAAQVQLAESEARYRAIFENTPYDVFGLTIDKKFVKVNSNFVNSWGRLEGRTLETLRPKSLSRTISIICDEVQINGAPIEQSYYYKLKSKHFRVIMAPNITEEKKILGYAGLIIDVTESSKSLQEKMKFAEALIQSSEDEQRRISREIHDSLGQMLFALQIDLSSIKAKLSKNEPQNELLFENAESILTRSMQEASNLCHRLHPRLLDDFGLQEALADIVANIEKSGRIEIDFDAQIKARTRNKNVETAIYRVVQEALANVLKHSRATKADLKVLCNHDGITLSIRDNGVGFNLPETLAKKKRGFGLLNMKERIEMIGGSLNIETALGQGVLIEIVVPN